MKWTSAEEVVDQEVRLQLEDEVIPAKQRLRLVGPCRYPGIHVELIGHDGQPWQVLGRVALALRHAGVAERDIDTFLEEAVAVDFNHMVRTVLEWVSIA